MTNIFTNPSFYGMINPTKEKEMLNVINWFKKRKNNLYVKPQKFVELKRKEATIEFIHAGHPLYDNIVDAEKNQLRFLAPNEAAYNENSLSHNFVAIVTYNSYNYLVINSFKHFKEQSIGGLLQFDENIYNVIPFFEDEEEYQTANNYLFSETYEYDHPVESYAFMAEHNETKTKIVLERGKKPINISMIDKYRTLFTEKLSQEQLELIDYTIIPAISAYTTIQEKRKRKVS